MARKVVVTLVDDFDGESKAEETVLFAVDGVGYELDLSVLNANRLRGVFEQWTPHARKVGRVQRGKNAETRLSGDRAQTAVIRDWARQRGMEVSSRGRVSAEIVAAYAEANA